MVGIVGEEKTRLKTAIAGGLQGLPMGFLFEVTAASLGMVAELCKGLQRRRGVRWLLATAIDEPAAEVQSP